MLRLVNHADYKTIDDWYLSRGQNTLRQFPKLGYIMPGVAAGFVYQTDSDICLVEGFVSNPKAPARKVFKAFDSITIACLKTSGAMGYTRVFAFTQKRSIKSLALRHCFTSRGDFMIFEKEMN